MELSNCTFGLPLAQVSALYSFYQATGGANWSYWNYSTTETAYYYDLEVLFGELGIPEPVLQNAVGGVPWNFDSFISNSSSSDTNPCTDNWQGISCIGNTTTQQCDVISLLLPFHNLTGSLPTDLYQLSNLQVLILNNNTIGRDISPILPLTGLNCVELFANSFSGMIPTQLGLLTDVSYLNLGANCLEGSIPTEIGSMASLRQFYLYHNAIVGLVPETLSNCANLLDLNLAVNSLYGTLPSQLSKLIHLKNLVLYQNSLEGRLPDMSDWKKLAFVRVQSNHLTGTIPSYIGSLANLEEFTVQYNRFQGTIPSTMGNLTKLQLLYLFNNYFTGSLPSTLALLSNLQSMLVQGNRFVGDLGNLFSSTEVLPSLQLVDFSSNRFSGSLPHFLFSLPNITFISLVNNCFQGSLSPLLCNVSATGNLSSLILNGLSAACGYENSIFEPTTITGSIPSCLFTVSSLQHLHLSGNGLTGRLPELEPSSWRNLRSIVMPFNRLQGPIPLTFKQAQLGHLDLSNNLIGGTCDDMMIFQYEPSARLNLTTNRLSGVFPASFYSPTATINILEGNLFGCTMPNQQLVRDPYYDDFICGSSSLDAFYMLFASTLVLCILLYAYWMPRLQAFYDTSVVHRQTTIDMLQEILARKSEISVKKKSGCLGSIKAWIRTLEDFLREMKLGILACGDSNIMGFERFPISQIFIILIMTEVRRISTILCGIFVTSFAIFILVMKYVNNEEYSTHSYQYGWVLSLSYINGAVPAIALYIMLWLIIIFLLVLFVKSGFRVNEAIQAHPALHKFETARFLTLWDWLEGRLWFSFILLLNAIVVVGVNAGYVYVQVEGGRITFLVQILLVVFKLVWNSVCVPVMCKWLADQGRASRLTERVPSAPLETQTWMIIFNNLLAPCIATMIIDKSCFFNYLYDPNQVSATYHYEMCAFVNGITGQCLVYFQYPYTVYYSLPFLYSDQCSSALVAAYVPVYILMYFYVAFLNPLYFAVPRLLSRSDWWLGRFLAKFFPRIFYHPSNLQDKENLRSLVNVGNIVANLTVHLVILVTFGAACPPLAIIVTIAIWSYTFQWQAIVGKFFLEAKNDSVVQSTTVREVLEPSDSLHPLICHGMGREYRSEPLIEYPLSVLIFAVFHRDCRGALTLFERVGRHVVLPMSLFYSLFLFDFLAINGVNFLYLPSTILLLPIVLRYGLRLWFILISKDTSIRVSESASRRFVGDAVVDMFNPMRFFTNSGATMAQEKTMAPTAKSSDEMQGVTTHPMPEVEMRQCTANP